ncbi:predicted protein [Bacteroides sp. CAG:702]|nr:predicted protein [Bacteroides sp. CAG:702]
MNNSFFCHKYLIFLLSFFSPMIIDVGGEVSPSFLFILLTLPFWSRYLNFRNDVVLMKFLPLFYVILLVQIIWIPFSHTELLTQIKGLMITVSGLLHFLFYYFAYRRSQEIIKWAALGTFLSSFFFVNVLAEVAGGDFGMWKFQIFPRLVSAGVLLYLWYCNKGWMKNIAPILLIAVGGIGLLTGARSSGLVPFSAGIIAFVLLKNKNIRIYRIKNYLIVGMLLLYGIYALIYVPNVMNGKISGGNSKQLQVTENPYNPVNLLMIGRTDAIVPFIAFMDRPITGWGYRTKDPGGKYHLIITKLKNEKSSSMAKYKINEKNIPGHSVWGYYSCSYGIVVFVALGLILLKTWRLVYYSLLVHDKYLLYRLFCVISVTWNILFSPISHFKWLPATIALVIVLSIKALNDFMNTNEIQDESGENIGCDSNLRLSRKSKKDNRISTSNWRKHCTTYNHCASIKNSLN